MIGRLLQVFRTRFARDAFMIQVTTLVQGGSYFLTSVLTKRYLGMEEMGRWVSAREMYTLAYFIVSMGIINATVSLYSEAVGQQDRKACVNALAAMLKIGVLTSMAVIALGLGFAPNAAERFYDDPLVGVWASWLCITGIFEVVRGLTIAALQGTRQMREYAWFDVTNTTLRVLIVWVALALGYGVTGVVTAFLIHMTLAGFVALGFYRRARDGHAKVAPPPLGEVLASVPAARVGPTFGRAWPIAVNKGMNTLVPRFGMLLIPALGLVLAQQAAFVDNAAYSIAYVISWGLGLAMSGVTQTLLPAMGLKLGAEDVPFEKLGGYFRRVSLATGGLMAALTVLSVPFAWLAIRYGYGEDATEAFPFYLWLVSGNLFIGFTVIVEAFYIYSGKLAWTVPWNLLFAALALTGIVLGGSWKGPIGVAAAAGLCRGFALFHLVYIWMYFRRARRRNTAS